MAAVSVLSKKSPSESEGKSVRVVRVARKTEGSSPEVVSNKPFEVPVSPHETTPARSSAGVSMTPTASKKIEKTKTHLVKKISEFKPKLSVPQAEERPIVKVKLPTLRQMLEAGSHFGHKVSRWNPAMRPYIFDTRAGMHIIDLTKTIGMLEDAVEALARFARQGNILLVGTKGQAATIIKNAGMDHGAFFINRRWPGGLLTNFKTVHKSVVRLMKIDEDLASGKGYETKHERLVLEREKERLMMLYEGICFMDSMPSAIVIVDTKVEKNAIKEARKKGVPVIAIVDTNCDPRIVDYPIPGNEDAIKSIDLFIGVLVQAFSNTETSARLIKERNDFRTRVEQVRRETEAEEERKRREREYEIARLKAMKEGKTVEMLQTGEVAPGGAGKVVRVVRKGTGAVVASKPSVNEKKSVMSVQMSTKKTEHVEKVKASVKMKPSVPGKKAVAKPKKASVKKKIATKKSLSAKSKKVKPKARKASAKK